MSHAGQPRFVRKGGVALSGRNCGEAYQRAVTGVPEAAALMRERSSYMTAYGALISSVPVLPIGSLAAGDAFADHGTRDAVIGAASGSR